MVYVLVYIRSFVFYWSWYRYAFRYSILFPHIAEVCLAASTCNSLNFTTHGINALICPLTKEGYTFMGIFSKVYWPCFFWATGTACGEIPPYLIAFAKSKAGEQVEEMVQVKNSEMNTKTIIILINPHFKKYNLIM
eukprot:UN33264